MRVALPGLRVPLVLVPGAAVASALPAAEPGPPTPNVGGINAPIEDPAKAWNDVKALWTPTNQWASFIDSQLAANGIDFEAR